MSDIEMITIAILTAALIFSLWQLTSKNGGDGGLELRKEIREMDIERTAALMNTLDALGKAQQEHLASVSKNIEKLKEGNEKKLDQMRETVDEKLQTTLEKRIGESFKLVSERLEAVQRGLGEMQNLATDVGGLKKVLTNVSTRGALGEIQAEQILQNILTPDQYDKNVKTHPDCKGQVEFAIKLPGPNGDLTNPIWLPIDCKFPKEDYERLLEAYDEGDKALIEKATNAFKSNVRQKAKTIGKEYVAEPWTTAFGVMFLPTEGLYADVVRQPGLFETLHRDYRIVVTGPSTLAAFVNSLQMGFRTLALETNASEVYNVLGAVKTEFIKFGDHMAKLHKQLNTAANTIGGDGDSIKRRLRAMERTLKDVESLPSMTNSELPVLENNEFQQEFEGD